MHKHKIIVLIATSMNRTHLLIERALRSILNQSRKPEAIIIVDDNDDSNESNKIQKELSRIPFPVKYLPNRYVHGYSGTGAWNTGIQYSADHYEKKSFIAILDDDDSWDSDYLENCESQIDDNTLAVFAFINRSDCGLLQFTYNDLNIKNFLIGDPGIQGSNMFFRTDALLDIGCFDESLHSCTDRDLMIRFLAKFSRNSIKIIPQKLVNYFSSSNTVSNISCRKNEGLIAFYKKYIKRYNLGTLNQALNRSIKLFSFNQAEHIMKIFQESLLYKSQETIAIGVAMHNNANTIQRCIDSILCQKNVIRKIQIIILNDNSTDQWQDSLDKYKSDPRIQIFSTSNSNVAATRNQLNAMIKEKVPNVALIGRLDADDEMCENDVLAKIENHFDETDADIIVAGNRLRKDGVIISRINQADTNLLDRNKLLERLRLMSEGVKEAELPSCNLFMKPTIVRQYPNIKSAEDHALLVKYLLSYPKINVQIAEDILYCIYNLSGQQTKSNKNLNQYLASRKLIYQEAKNG